MTNPRILPNIGFGLIFFSVLAFSANFLRGQTTKPYPVCSSSKPSDSGSCATPPKVTSNPGPRYTADGRKNKIEGTVILDFVVMPDGTPQEIQVTQGLGHGLDEESVNTLKQWHFEPGTVEGKAVPVKFTAFLNFSLSGSVTGPAFPGPVAIEDATKLYNEASNADDAGDCGKAISLALEATQVDPQHWNAWNLLGLCYYRIDDMAASEAAFQRQIEVSPQHATAYNNLATVYMYRREYDKALVQLRKQLEINPGDRLSLRNTAYSLKQQRKYKDSATAYLAAIAAEPNNSYDYAYLAEDYFELGMQAEAMQAVDKAIALTTTGSGWNEVAWVLASHNVDLERAERFAKLGVSLSSANLISVSLNPLTPDIYARISSLGSVWDTLGWIKFLRGENALAEKYMMAAWLLERHATIGDHLAQLYDKLGNHDEAVKYSGLAIAALQTTASPENSDIDAAARSRERLSRLAPGRVQAVIHDTAEVYSHLGTSKVSVSEKREGDAQFALLQKPDGKTSETQFMAGDAVLRDLSSQVALQVLPIPPPADDGVYVPRWATVTCSPGQKECTLRVLGSREAVRAEARSKVKPETEVALSKSNEYSSDSLGFSLTLPQDWSKVEEASATAASPASVTFARQRTLCSLTALRYHLEATEDTFNKLVESRLRENESFQVLSTNTVVRDGISGFRIIANFEGKNVKYHDIIETFTAGDLHYQLVAEAPLDDFGRYAAELEKTMSSVRFLGLHIDATSLKQSTH